MPRNAAWPKQTMPPKPMTRFRLDAASAKIMMRAARST